MHDDSLSFFENGSSFFDETLINNSETHASTRETSDDSLIDQVKITNNLLCGIIFFMGLLFGLIGLHVLFSRIGNGKEK